MIPRLAETAPVQADYLDFLKALEAQGFKGDIGPDYANRTVLATDNSIYQVLPQGVIYPRDADDLALVARLAGEERFRSVELCPRGGGTSTNGQSLTDGIVVDVSRHMNRILEINVAERWARVEAGVVKDQLNAALEPHGLFFAPELSTSNRATIGGMINTDASGQGSCRYGKTRDHVLELKSIFLDGTVWESRPLDDGELERVAGRADRVGEVHRTVDAIFRDKADLIAERFPKLNRCLTGYDLAHVRDGQGRFDLNSILCGAEGTLAFVAEAKLNLLPTPPFAAIVCVRYPSFQDTLRDARELMKAGPTSIETVDSKVLTLAMNDIVWDSVRDMIPDSADAPTRGLNLVEFTADRPEDLKRDVSALTAALDAVRGQPGKNLGWSLSFEPAQIAKLWAMRKRSVGLLGNAEGDRRPIPFVEDTAVPPENLADYIGEFRAVLDRHDLDYGMFGHVDAGVLHVRPAIDMKDPAQETLIRAISDEVVALTRKYKGLLWGEHGKGMRSEYAPELFGPLYPSLQRIKAAFDPRNQLNPGKICTPAGSGADLLKIDGVGTRGRLDRTIPAPVRNAYGAALHCNGNAACFNFDPNDAMCPSWKGTRQRIHSPKGRASLFREWLRLLADRGVDPVVESRSLRDGSFLRTLLPRLRNSLSRRSGEYDFSHEVLVAMSGCLACKSCASQCPIKVDVPDFRSSFLELYYGRYLRPVKDYLVGSLEHLLPWVALAPGLYNRMMGNRLVAGLVRRHVGMVDLPALSGIDLGRELKRRGVVRATPAALEALPAARRDRAVIIVQDAFTSYYETRLVLDLVDLALRLGFVPLVAPFRPNGKPLHVHGFLKAFERVAGRNAAMLRGLAAFGVPLVGVDPAMTLAYRSEYVKALGPDAVPRVLLIQEWLAGKVGLLERREPRPDGRTFTSRPDGRTFTLLAHCTEKTAAVPSVREWQAVFAALGGTLEHVAVGCCGMAGTYGHEAANAEMSRRIYGQSWSAAVGDPARRDRLVATGYSCRSQVKRIEGRPLRHPVQALLDLVPPASAK